ncbi:hypothetical protein FHX82_005683 [Amycolatopsis bartoniae]|nr:ATP-grasp domain-containing protein [Amycolatopsis bartoniae]MBB2938605.1 hypothetical protein [Amycolatopsis bartoniae]TVT08895.1 ATP-grasp domain-containing protein [Amycolatopsis bartoniae]
MIVLGYREGLDSALRRRGLDPFYVVEKQKAGLAGKRYRLVSRLEDAQQVLRAVTGAGLTDVAGALTGHEQGVFATALLRAQLDLPGDRDFGKVLLFRDKYLQKNALPAEVARARCRYVTPEDDFAALAADLGVPFVVKPADGYGATRTAVVETAAEFARMVGDRHVSDVAFVAESYVRGDEIHVDGVWEDGRLLWNSVGVFHQPVLSWSRGGVVADHLVTAEGHPELVARATRVAETSLGALGAPDCVFHLEGFDDGTTTFFGECAIRLAGAHIVEIVAMTHGVDLYEAQVALALGEPAKTTVQPRPPVQRHAYVYLRHFAGRALTADDFRRRFSLVELDFPDPTTASPRSYGRAGHAILADRDETRLRARVAELVRFNEGGDDSNDSEDSDD